MAYRRDTAKLLRSLILDGAQMNEPYATKTAGQEDIPTHIDQCTPESCQTYQARAPAQGRNFADGLLAHLEELGWAWIPAPSRADPLDILSNLGPLIPSNDSGADYHDLKPYSHDDAPSASMSAITGTGPQPMHTDAAYRPEAPRHVALQCMNPGEALCPTHVWSLDIDRLASELHRSGSNTLSRPDPLRRVLHDSH
jgi:hypothetical protein